MSNDFYKKIGVLLINLGTPSAPTTSAVRTYLAEFLDDPRVIDLPSIIRKVLVYGTILPFRSKKTAKAYRAIFDPKKGSPLLYYSKDLTQSLQTILGSDYHVVLGMRYGKPALKTALHSLIHSGCQEIVVLPLFPQYSSAVNGSALEALSHFIKQYEIIPSFSIISEFYQRPEFIQAQSVLINETLMNAPNASVVFSYHSLPTRQIRKSSNFCLKSCFEGKACPDIGLATQHCYRAKCFATSKALAKQLGLDETRYRVAFQSRLGRTEWIGPDFNAVLKELRQKNVKDLIIACPSFAVDCLETLEEIGLRGKEKWQSLGGDSYQLVPCLNDNPHWVKAVANWIRIAAREPLIS